VPVLFATLALLPPLLQDLLNYPVVTTGLVTARAGLAPWSRCSSSTDDGQGRHPLDHRHRLCVDRLFPRADDRIDLQMDTAMVVWSGLSQGLGTGFVYVPLAAAARDADAGTAIAEGTAIFQPHPQPRAAASAFRW